MEPTMTLKVENLQWYLDLIRPEKVVLSFPDEETAFSIFRMLPRFGVRYTKKITSYGGLCNAIEITPIYD